jgi:hypothetical protein
VRSERSVERRSPGGNCTRASQRMSGAQSRTPAIERQSEKSPQQSPRTEQVSPSSRQTEAHCRPDSRTGTQKCPQHSAARAHGAPSGSQRGERRSRQRRRPAIGRSSAHSGASGQHWPGPSQISPTGEHALLATQRETPSAL